MAMQDVIDWTEAEDEQLRVLVLIHRTPSWKAVAEQIPGRTSQEVKKRYALSSYILDTRNGDGLKTISSRYRVLTNMQL